jgi:hypothetical protein
MAAVRDALGVTDHHVGMQLRLVARAGGVADQREHLDLRAERDRAIRPHDRVEPAEPHVADGDGFVQRYLHDGVTAPSVHRMVLAL